MDVFVIIGILIFYGCLEIGNGYFESTNRNFGDWMQEAGGFFALSLLIKPLLVFTVYTLGTTFFADYQYILSGQNFWLLFITYILIDDLMQYWYHRSAHEYEFLWKLHRSHHQAEEMGFFISYRNAGLYYILMPNIWWVALFTFLGGALPVAIGLILKQIIIIGSHSTLSWDKVFYKYKFLTPVINVLERIFITPAFHHAHHGKTKLDGISDPNGNFGNMFSIWDQIFGTAQFNHAFPTDYGLENDPKENWTVSYFYPFVKAKDPENEMSKNYKKPDTRTFEPAEVTLEKGKQYLYCACGNSKNQPFCDSSHHGTKFKPVLFEAKRTGKVRLCNCKATKTGPFCDDSHIELR